MSRCRQSWITDPKGIASKIRSALGSSDPKNIECKSNPTMTSPNCRSIIDNSDVAQEWPGLPRGVKFDPSDQEIILHLLAKSDDVNFEPHPFIDEFIPTVDKEDGICYTHPQNLPGVKQDGSVAHFFHRAVKAFNTGTRKRRKIHGENSGDVRWHKTGRTKQIFLDGMQKACKKIMVLYLSPGKGGKTEKTNWVMHQYHLGTEEDEKEGEYVLSKIFYQQQQVKITEKNEEETPESVNLVTSEVDPIAPKLVTECGLSSHETGQDSMIQNVQNNDAFMEDEAEPPSWQPIYYNSESSGFHLDQEEGEKDEEEVGEEENIRWENESQYLVSTQQLAQSLSVCGDLFQSQSSKRDENQGVNNKPCLADYARLGPNVLKRDLEECQNLVIDPTVDISLGTPPDLQLSLGTPQDFRLSHLEFGSRDVVIDPTANNGLGPLPDDLQLSLGTLTDLRLRLTPPDNLPLSQPEFESQDSYIAWGGSRKRGTIGDN